MLDGDEESVTLSMEIVFYTFTVNHHSVQRCIKYKNNPNLHDCSLKGDSVATHLRAECCQRRFVYIYILSRIE